MARGPNGQVKKKPRTNKRPLTHKPRPAAPNQVAVPTIWEIFDCRINDTWEDTGRASIMVLRRNPRLDDYWFSAFLIDLSGFGLKDGFERPHVTRRYIDRAIERANRHAMREEDPEPMNYHPCSLDLARELVFGGIE